MINLITKEWIDKATYKELLYKWRFTESSNPIFQGETGSYYLKIMKERESELPQGMKSTISKEIGWG